MSKKVLVITSSLRKGANSDILAESFADGARAAGNEVEILSLADKTIGFCKGCLACMKTKKCVISDDAIAITEKMNDAEVIAFASPVYYYSICGQLKTMLDRANSLYASDYAFRDVYLLSVAAEDEESAVEGSEKAIQGWVDCFANANFAGTVFAGGVEKPGDIKGHAALQKAFELGKSIK